MAALEATIQGRLVRTLACALDGRVKPGHDVGEVGACYFGARLARMRCSVRRCMLRRRAVSETLRLQSS